MGTNFYTPAEAVAKAVGTNFYAPVEAVAKAVATPVDIVKNFIDDDRDPGIHIGKRSMGWKFSFRGHPMLNITTLEDWKAVLDNAEKVFDEYNGELSAEEFWDGVQETEGGRRHDDSGIRVNNDYDFRDSEFF